MSTKKNINMHDYVIIFSNDIKIGKANGKSKLLFLCLSGNITIKFDMVFNVHPADYFKGNNTVQHYYES